MFTKQSKLWTRLPYLKRRLRRGKRWIAFLQKVIEADQVLGILGREQAIQSWLEYYQQDQIKVRRWIRIARSQVRARRVEVVTEWQSLMDRYEKEMEA